MEHLRIGVNNGTFSLQIKKNEKTKTFTANSVPQLFTDKAVVKVLRLKKPIDRQKYNDIFVCLDDGGYGTTDWPATLVNNDGEESGEQ